MNDKSAAKSAVKSPLRLNRETLKHLSARTGLRTGFGIVGATGACGSGVGASGACNTAPPGYNSYNACAQSNVCYAAGGGLVGGVKAG